MNKATTSGDGTRPSTSAGSDNLGAGKRFTGKRAADGSEVSAPGPAEGMRTKRKEAASASRDDSSAFELHEDLTPEPSRDPSQRPSPGSHS